MHQHRLDSIIRSVSRGESQETLAITFRHLCELVGTPRALTAWILFENREYEQLVNLSVNPLSYEDTQVFADDYFISKVLSKYQDFKHDLLKPRESALKTFEESEVRCRETNDRFKRHALGLGNLFQGRDPSLQAILQLARRKIKFVLGKIDFESIESGFGWGPGATTSVVGSRTSAYAKFQSRLDVTSNTLIMGHFYVNRSPSWVCCQLQTDDFPSRDDVRLTRAAFNVVRGNEVVLVPKTAKTMRTIAKEPTVNAYLQRGLGRYIRKRLMRLAGVDLDDQSVNQRLARQGSLTGKLATIDLKSASDTVSTELVKYLLPRDWFHLLDMVRSKQGLLPGKTEWFYYHKFSSSGNGATFELESLIFWALSKATQEIMGYQDGVLSVYGDDLVVDVRCYGRVTEVLDLCGFWVNHEKSYSQGWFRESCGKDYFRGTIVRPFFIKRMLSNAQELFKLANSVRRYSHSRNLNYGCDKRFVDVWNFIVQSLPDHFRGMRIPYDPRGGLADAGLVSNFDEALPTLSAPKGWRDGWDGFVCRVLMQVPIRELMKDGHAGYTAKLYAIGAEMPSLDYHSLRNMTKPKIGKLYVPRASGWYNLGPWC